MYHRVTRLQLSILVAEAKNDPRSTIALISALQGPNGIMNFDQKTGTKAVTALLASLSPDYTERYMEELFKKFHTIRGEEGTVGYFPTHIEKIANRKWPLANVLGSSTNSSP